MSSLYSNLLKLEKEEHAKTKTRLAELIRENQQLKSKLESKPKQPIELSIQDETIDLSKLIYA